jgi:L-threonylcarbamoyladenylate synthase
MTAISPWRPGAAVAPLAARLARGGLLAVPTESSYGLAVDPRHQEGVAAVYRLKERERGKPLPVVAADLAQLAALGVDLVWPALATVSRFWPAPLTLVVPVGQPLPAAAGTGTLAVRIPAHPLLRGLLAALGHALTATSANRSGEPPLDDPAAVAAWLKGEDAEVVDGGRLGAGAPSTIVASGGDGSRLTVVRAGSFPLSRLAPWLEIETRA